MTNIAPPTITPASVISRPADHHDRRVTSDLAAPTRKWATREMIAAAMMATVPVVSMKGTTGTIPPMPVLIPAAMAACVGLPEPPTLPNSSAARAWSMASGCLDRRSASSSAVFSSMPLSW
ncbi:MAG: hypothetical protein M3065_17650 [Actinomycetota bacterium]|nr:hypothetical protein [Actinomycetota bacterium]